MTVDITSRYKYTTSMLNNVEGGDGYTYLATQESAFFIDDSENEMHIVKLGDTLESIAHQYFKGFPNSAQLFWIIGEYQPTPILDPTLKLKVGSLIIIPAQSIVYELLYARLEDIII